MEAAPGSGLAADGAKPRSVAANLDFGRPVDFDFDGVLPAVFCIVAIFSAPVADGVAFAPLGENRRRSQRRGGEEDAGSHAPMDARRARRVAGTM